MHYYQVTGYIYRCNEKIEQLFEIEPTENFDVDILIENVPKEIALQVEEMPAVPYFYWTSDYVWLHNKYGVFAVYKSGKIYLQAADSKNKLILLQFVLGYGIAMYAHLNGRIAIHCGCVNSHDKGIIITGTSGSGKSTLTAELISDGAVMLADDMIVTGYDDNGFPTIYPAFPQQKLCRDAAIKKGYDLDKLLYIDPDKDKFAINRQDIFSPEPHRLDFAFQLVAYNPDLEKNKKYNNKVFVEKLKGTDKVKVFTNQLFLGEIFHQIGFPPEQFEVCLNTAKFCSVYKIYRPIGLDTLSEIKEIIYNICKKQDESYVEILKDAIFQKTVDTTITEEINLPMLYQFGSLNKINVLCSSIIKNWCQSSDSDKEFANMWKIESAGAIMKEQQKRQLLKTLFDNASKEGLSPVLFKGYVLANLYPDFTFRNSGDTDLFIESLHYDRMVKFLTDTGYVQAHYLDTPTVHTFFYNENEETIHKIELHTSLYEDMTGPRIDILNAIDMTAIDNCITVDCCGLEFTTLNHTNHLIYQIFHMAKHICCHGISIRYLADISLFVTNYRADIDFEKFWEIIDKLGYRTFCIHLFSICIKYFDVDKEILLNNSFVYDASTNELLHDLVHFGMRSKDEKLSGQFFYFEQYIEKKYTTISDITFDGTTVPYSEVSDKWQKNIELQERIAFLKKLQLL